VGVKERGGQRGSQSTPTLQLGIGGYGLHAALASRDFDQSGSAGGGWKGEGREGYTCGSYLPETEEFWARWLEGMWRVGLLREEAVLRLRMYRSCHDAVERETPWDGGV